MAVAEAGDIVFVTTEVLLLCSPILLDLLVGRGKNLLEFEGAELLVYDLPDNLVGGHGGQQDVISIEFCGRSLDFPRLFVAADCFLDSPEFLQTTFFFLDRQNRERR